MRYDREFFGKQPKPKNSVVVVVYNMAREALRTLQSLSESSSRISWSMKRPVRFSGISIHLEKTLQALLSSSPDVVQ